MKIVDISNSLRHIEIWRRCDHQLFLHSLRCDGIAWPSDQSEAHDNAFLLSTARCLTARLPSDSWDYSTLPWSLRN